MASDLKSKIAELQQRRGQQKQLLKQQAENKLKLRELTRDKRLTEQAQIVIQKVAFLTQQELQYRISDLVSLALASVFNDPYKFEVEFVVRRDRTECDLWFVRNRQRIHPLSASGGGAVDVACFALRVALWKLSLNKTRPVLVLDEPLKHLSTDLQPRANAMIKEISKQMGLQILMISHVADIVDSADTVFKTTIRNGVTTIR